MGEREADELLNDWTTTIRLDTKFRLDNSKTKLYFKSLPLFISCFQFDPAMDYWSIQNEFGGTVWLEAFGLFSLKNLKIFLLVKPNCFLSLSSLCGNNVFNERRTSHFIQFAFYQSSLFGRNERCSSFCCRFDCWRFSFRRAPSSWFHTIVEGLSFVCWSFKSNTVVYSCCYQCKRQCNDTIVDRKTKQQSPWFRLSLNNINLKKGYPMC